MFFVLLIIFEIQKVFAKKIIINKIYRKIYIWGSAFKHNILSF